MCLSYSFCMFLSYSFCIFLSLSFSLCPCYSIHEYLCVSISIFLCACLFHVSQWLSFSINVYQCVFTNLSTQLPLYLSHPIYVSLYYFSYLPLSFSFSLSLSDFFPVEQIGTRRHVKCDLLQRKTNGRRHEGQIQQKKQVKLQTCKFWR